MVFFPETVAAPDGARSFAVLHRPMWDLGEIAAGRGRAPARRRRRPAAGHLDQLRAGRRGRRATSANLTRWTRHRFVAGPEFAFEELKIGGGPPPLRVPEGWLLLHHGVTGHDRQRLRPAAARELRGRRDDPGRRRPVEGDRPHLRAAARAPRPRRSAAASCPTSSSRPPSRRSTAAHFVFYGMADSKIGVARLLRTDE